ncbi:MAG: hypothetical protein BHW14_03560 [Coprococcus sp. 43_8]|nr:MAG: hypothetical protein BHW14_03560 [Coprococcus sp. 43_8]
MLNNVKTREEINTRAHLYGWDLDGGGFVAIIDINNIKKYYLRDLDTGTNEKLQKYTDRIFDTSIKCIKQAFPSTIYYSQSDFIAFLITGKLPVSARKTLADTFSQIQHSTATNRQSRSSRLSIRFSNLTVCSFMIRLESIVYYFLFHPITRQLNSAINM